MFIFTDGGCTANGRENSKASFASYFIKTNDMVSISNKEKFIIRGYVLSFEYAYDENTNNIYITTQYIKPSNNRGELLAIIHALLYIIDNIDKYNEKITIYSDSLICVRTINEWYDKRLKKGTINEFKNFDLIKILMNLVNKLKRRINIEIKHVKSHQKITNNMSIEQKNIINSNNIVDKHCIDLLNNKNDDSKYDNNKNDNYEYISIT